MDAASPAIYIEGAGSNGVNGHYQRRVHVLREGNDIYLVHYWKISEQQQMMNNDDVAFYICRERYNTRSPWFIGCLRRVNESVRFVKLYLTNPLQQSVSPPVNGWWPHQDGERPSPTLRPLINLANQEWPEAIVVADTRRIRRMMVRRAIMEMIDVICISFSSYVRTRPLMNGTACVICGRVIRAGSRVAILRCNCYRGNNQRDRVLHARCLEDCFINGHDLCPMCRYPLRN